MLGFCTVVLAAVLVSGPPRQAPVTSATKLTAHILRVNPKATPYAAELASRILAEGKRTGQDPVMLATVAWIESDYRRGLRGRAHEIGVWQLRPFDHGMGSGWAWLRARAARFPVVGQVPQLPWKRLRWRHRRLVLDDIKAGTYLAAYSISRHVRMCRRLRHRVGPRRPCSKPFLAQCPRYHKHEIDRVGHFNSGVSWPRPAYLWKLRRRYRIIKRRLR